LSVLAIAFFSGGSHAADNLGLVHVLVQATIAALFILPLRVLRYRMRYPDPTISNGDVRRSSQFSIADLLAAAFAVSVAGAIVIRIPPPEWVFTSIEVIKTLVSEAFVKFWPMASITVLAVCGMRSHRWLGAQVLLSGLIALLPSSAFRDPYGEPLAWMSFSWHWFLVAGTLWIFQMCGWRLVLTTAARPYPTPSRRQSR
jgi:hypothetical protein